MRRFGFRVTAEVCRQFRGRLPRTPESDNWITRERATAPRLCLMLCADWQGKTECSWFDNGMADSLRLLGRAREANAERIEGWAGSTQNQEKAANDMSKAYREAGLETD